MKHDHQKLFVLGDRVKKAVRNVALKLQKRLHEKPPEHIEKTKIQKKQNISQK